MSVLIDLHYSVWGNRTEGGGKDSMLPLIWRRHGEREVIKTGGVWTLFVDNGESLKVDGKE